jgi:uncharacterized protein
MGSHVFGIILTLAATLICLYVVWRTSSVPFLRRHVPRKVLIPVAIVPLVLFVLVRFVGNRAPEALATPLEFLAMTWMGVLFLCSAMLLATDIVTGFGFFCRRRVPMLRGWALIAAGALSIFALIQANRAPVVRDYEVLMDNLPANLDGTVLVAISDLHLGELLGKRWLQARVLQVQELRPDMVVLLGDIFEGHGPPPEELANVFRRLNAPLGVWGVLGNHEFHGGGQGASTLMGQAGIEVLRNRWVSITPGFIIAGVDDLTSARRSGLGDSLVTKALADRPPGATVLLSHTPWQTEVAAQAGVGLMLCGHTHGGQLWPFGYLSRIWYPLQGGRYEIDGMTTIVCRGTGTWGPPMRLWRPCEILRITLRPQGTRPSQ